MTKRKLRILQAGESSFLSTGFSTYSMELLKHLHGTGKYELFELGAYGDPNDGRCQGTPWPYRTCMPTSDAEAAVYHQDRANVTGQYKFEQACLDFRPDVVVDVRDWWDCEYQERSPFRRLFHWALMPTVDAEPQRDEWLSSYLNADAVFTYSDWGAEVLKRETAGAVKYVATTPPGADLGSFLVRTDRTDRTDRAALRQRMGVPADALVVGTVMRNQRRKLYPDLIESFATFLAGAPEEMSRRAVLYLHTAYPDIGWDIPRLVNEAGVGHKTFVTYYCKSCGHTAPERISDSRKACSACGELNAVMPTTQLGVSRKSLGEIMALFDVYVQYSVCEGFGMPLVEAAACGVPVMAVDYSAMSDVVRKLGGTPIKVQRFSRESETGRKLALPDNGDLVANLVRLFRLPEPVRANRGYAARAAVERHYTWPQTCKTWEDYLDSVEPKDPAATWLSPLRRAEPAKKIPAGLTDADFVRWGFANVACRPDLVNSYRALRLTREMIWSGRAETRDEAVKIWLGMADQFNHWEVLRASRIQN